MTSHLLQELPEVCRMLPDAVGDIKLLFLVAREGRQKASNSFQSAVPDVLLPLRSIVEVACLLASSKNEHIARAVRFCIPNPVPAHINSPMQNP